MKIIKRLSVAILIFFALLGLVEGVCRLATKAERGAEAAVYESDPVVGFRFASNLRMDGLTSTAYGTRGRDPATPAAKRILVTGDSMTIGIDVPDESTFCARLERLLGPDSLVVNAACPGYGPIQERAAIERMAPVVKPTKIIVMFFSGNDISDAGWEENPYVVLGGRLVGAANVRDAGFFTIMKHTLRAHLWSSGVMRAARTFGRRSETPAGQTGADEGPCGMSSPDIKALMVSEDYFDFPKYTKDNNSFPGGVNPLLVSGWRNMRGHYEKIAGAAKAANAELVVGILPLPLDYDLALRTRIGKHWNLPPGKIDGARPSRKMVELLKSSGIRTVDFTDSFRKSPKGGKLHLPGDLHLSAEGHELVAAELARQLF